MRRSRSGSASLNRPALEEDQTRGLGAPDALADFLEVIAMKLATVCALTR
jgi:hypothetical protein